jgi:hypothetical protein
MRDVEVEGALDAWTDLLIMSSPYATSNVAAVSGRLETCRLIGRSLDMGLVKVSAKSEVRCNDGGRIHEDAHEIALAFSVTCSPYLHQSRALDMGKLLSAVNEGDQM